MNLRFRSLRIDDAVLSRNLVTVSLSVRDLFLLVILQTLLKLGLQVLRLPRLHTLGAILRFGSIALEILDLVPDLGVLELRLGDQVLELLRGAAIGRGQGPLVQRGDLLDVRAQGSDLGFGKVDAREEVLLREDRGGLRDARSTGIGVIRRL